MNYKYAISYLVIILFVLSNLTNAENFSKGQISLKNLLDDSLQKQLEILEGIKKQNLDYKTFEILARLLTHSKNIQVKREIIAILAKDKNISIDKKAPLLLNALRKEITNPTTLKYPEGSYMPGSEYIKRQLQFSLEKLGYKCIPYIKNAYQNATGEYKDRLVILLAVFKIPNTFESLLKISKNSPDGFVRSLAVRSLGILENKKAVPALETALNDPFSTISNRCIITNDPAFNKIYPVREEAFRALKILGVKVKRSGNKFWVVE